MTRDEATKKLRDAVPAWGSGAMLVDSLVALGMLKLDEPLTLDVRVNVAINTELFSGREKCAGNVKAALDRASLKIVEK